MFKVGTSKETKTELFGDLPNMTHATVTAHTWEFYLKTNFKRTSVSTGKSMLFFCSPAHQQVMNTKLVIQSLPQALVRIHKDRASSLCFFIKESIKKQIIANTHSY